MKRLVVLGALLALTASAAFAAPSATRQAVDGAAKACKEERKAMGVEAFKNTYGGKANAFGKCVSSKSKGRGGDDEAETAAEAEAAKDCKAERSRIGIEAFKNKYGTNKNKANAFGKCVSGKTKDDEGEDDGEAESAAARECRAERDRIGVEAFKNKYGTNPNKANAFGKCVSAQSKR